jgi:hypothetical protein
MMRSTPLPDLRIRELLELIGSTSVSPGAGAAGAVTLALAAACAAKAVSISWKHSPDDDRLGSALSSLEKIRDFALQGADADSRAFADFVKNQNASNAAELIETGEAMSHLIDALMAIIDRVEGGVKSRMGGDLVAAKSLAAAARTIQSTNEAEAKEEQRGLL